MQVERPVINASPLIFLARVDGLEWITKIAANPDAVPLAVRNEVAAGAGGAAIVAHVESSAGFYIVNDAPVAVKSPPGILALANRRCWRIRSCNQIQLPFSDDTAARDCARALNLRLLGTLGIVMIAKRRGWIDRVQPVVALTNALRLVRLDISP